MQAEQIKTSLGCFCKDNFDAPSCEGRTVGRDRPRLHRYGGWGGGDLKSCIPIFKVLCETGVITKFSVDRTGIVQCVDFETIDGVCASQLSYYLVFQD